MPRFLLVVLLASSSLFAAGSVQQSLQQLGGQSGLTWVVVFHWTGDATTGSVPVTRANIGRVGVLQGYYITSVETTPLSPAPTSGYGLTINDQAGVDALTGAAASLSSTAAQAFPAALSLPPINGSFTLNITGQNVPGAKGAVYVYLQDPTSLIGSGSVGPAGPPGPGVTGLTGIIEGHGSGSPTGNQAAVPLTYLRRSANGSAVGYEFAALPMLYSNDYVWSQTPGGSISIGANTVQLTPGPLGLTSAKANTYVEILAGVGTAEPVLLTGGSCDGTGQANCTIVFTAAHTHSGSFTIGTAQAGHKEAFNLLGPAGGCVQSALGNLSFYQTLYIGDGTATTKSTIDGICLIGQGAGRGADVAIPNAGSTTFVWLGPAGGTVVKVAGPIGNVVLSDFDIDAGATAAVGLDVVHSFLSSYKRINIRRWTSIGLRSQHVDFAFPNMVTGNNNNVFDSIISTNGSGGGSQVACWLGTQVPNVHTIFDFASNLIINSSCVGGAGTGMDLSFADNNTFLMTNFSGTTAAVNMVSSSNGAPFANTFLQSPLGSPLMATPSSLNPISPNIFLPLTTGEFTQDLGSIVNYANGFSSAGEWFGRMKNAPLYYSSATNPSPIANTVAETAFGHTYTIAANTLNLQGAILRIKASGRYSTTGSPSLTFKVKLGTLIIGTFISTTAIGAAGAAFNLDSEAVVNTAGVGALLIGPSQALLGGVAPVTSSTVGAQGLDTTVSNLLSLTATWGEASPYNTVTLDSLTAEILYPSVSQ